MTWVRLKTVLAGLMVSIFALLAGGLVVYDILRQIKWQMPSFLENAIGAETAPARQDEIRKYVQFSQVKYGSKTVFTGVEYASDRDRRITTQWCYIDGTLSGGRSVKMTLANKDGSGHLIVSKPTQSALADFDLTRSTMRALVKSHCRFQ